MPTIYEALQPMIALAFLLGMKHGMDADHLATIDGLTRFNAASHRPRLARLCGFLFSIGHGAVVCVVAVSASQLFKQMLIPGWLDNMGAWISTFFLLSLSVLNLHAVFTTPQHEMVKPLGFKGKLLGRLNHSGHPAMVLLVGALFALSFDTISQAALFSAASIHFGSTLYALILALCFMLGMMLTDAINGLWISHLLRRADATARTASRIMGLSIAMLSLVVAGLGLSRRYLSQAAVWQEGKELAIGILVITAVATSFLIARYWPRRAYVTSKSGS